VEQKVPRTLTWFIAFLVIAFSFSGVALADEASPAPSSTAPKMPPDLAKRIGKITDAVLANHIDPPARQQMILGGVKALYRASGATVPSGLSRRVSALTTSEQLAAVLVDIWPKTTAKPIAATALEKAMLDGLLTDVPGDAELISEKDRVVTEQSEGNRYVGIHIALGLNDKEKRPSIAQVLEGGPADRAGVKNDDLIDLIDGVDTKGMILREAVDRLRGQEGSHVTIKVRQPKTTDSRTYTIRRGQHARATVLGARKRPAGGWDYRLDGFAPIAYLRIVEISASTPHELRRIAQQLENQGNLGVVLDLRGLSGQSVHPAVMLADMLIAGGTIGRVQTIERETTFQADPDALFRTFPVAVLVDPGTRGTAEWIAAALQDNHRAMIVGTPTFSAMNANEPRTSQWTDMKSRVSVGDGTWAIELTTGRLKRGDGRPISTEVQGNQPEFLGIRRNSVDLDKVTTGIKPDHIVPTDGTGQSMRAPYRFRQAPGQEPKSDNDVFLLEAVRLLRQSLQKFI
jgi:carboxyl-terminal processing protease